jgi:uncharacterized repeat protein (TIGR03803 family)
MTRWRHVIRTTLPSSWRLELATLSLSVAIICLDWLVCGTVRAQAQSGTESVLYSFCSQPGCTDGAAPLSGLVQGGDGNFYGATSEGGDSFDGTVFKLTPSGTLTTLHSFCSQAGCSDGATPLAALVEGGDGNFYGTTYQGGNANSAGTVFKISPAGSFTTLYTFCSRAGCSDGVNPWAQLTVGRDGNFYGTTELGGTNNWGTVFKITPAGRLTTLYSFCSRTDCSDGNLPLASLTEVRNGNFYSTTYGGGAHLKGTVFKIAPSGKLTTLHSFCRRKDCTDGALPWAGLAQGKNGDFYGTTWSGGPAYGTVFKVTPSGASTTLYRFCNPVSALGCTDGAIPWAGLTESNKGIFFGTTSVGGVSFGTVFEITPSGKLTTIYSFCSQADSLASCTDGEVPRSGLVKASDGNLYGTTEEGGANTWGTVFRLAITP